jgi:putative PIN family toxin of toxin-antitoxin system
MRIVVDTNVLISAALKDKSVPASAAHLVQQRHILLKSSATERQLVEVSERPYLALLIAPAAQVWLRQLLANAEPVQITERIEACRDPTDDKFLELAINGAADLILSGDADLLVLNPFRGIPIVTPAMFLQTVGSGEMPS